QALPPHVREDIDAGTVGKAQVRQHRVVARAVGEAGKGRPDERSVIDGILGRVLCQRPPRQFEILRVVLHVEDSQWSALLAIHGELHASPRPMPRRGPGRARHCPLPPLPKSSSAVLAGATASSLNRGKLPPAGGGPQSGLLRPRVPAGSLPGPPRAVSGWPLPPRCRRRAAGCLPSPSPRPPPPRRWARGEGCHSVRGRPRR